MYFEELIMNTFYILDTGTAVPFINLPCMRIDLWSQLPEELHQPQLHV